MMDLTEAENTPSRRTLERAAFVDESDTVVRCKGSEQTVGRYRWLPANGAAR